MGRIIKVWVMCCCNDKKFEKKNECIVLLIFKYIVRVIKVNWN